MGVRLPVRLTELDSVVFVVLMLLGAFYASANMSFCAVGLFVLRFLLLSTLRITLKTNTDVWEAAVGH